MAAWKLKYAEHIMTIFFDGTHCIHVPCADPSEPTIDDKWLWRHVSFFYRMLRIQAGPISWLLPTSLVRIEIVEVSYPARRIALSKLLMIE